MKHPFDKILGIILSENKTNQYETLNLLDKDWFTSTFHKNVYDAMYGIMQQNNLIDILNVTTWLRENDRYEKDTAFRVSDLSTQISFTDQINKLGVINSCWYAYSVRKTFLMVQKVNDELNTEAPRSKFILDQVTVIKDLLTTPNTKKVESNIDSIDTVLKRHNEAKQGIPLGLELGWDNLKGQILLEPDDVMIVGGRPAMGKTAWAISLISNLCFKQNICLVFYSLEMSKDRIIRRVLSNITGIDSNKIKYGNCTPSEINALESVKGLKGWENLHVFDGSQTCKDIEVYLTSVTNKQKVDVFCIDYIQKILPSRSGDRYQEVTKISNDVKRIVMQHRIPCIALAQLNRDVARSGKRPSLPDLKESGEIEQDASIVCFLHRPEYYGETVDHNGNDMTGIGEFITAKNRDGSIGITEMKVVLQTSEWNDYERYFGNFEVKQTIDEPF